MQKLELIKKVSRLVTDSELKALRIEEELLIELVQKSGESLALKKKAFEQMNLINKRQTEIIGSSLK